MGTSAGPGHGGGCEGAMHRDLEIDHNYILLDLLQFRATVMSER